MGDLRAGLPRPGHRQFKVRIPRHMKIDLGAVKHTRIGVSHAHPGYLFVSHTPPKFSLRSRMTISFAGSALARRISAAWIIPAAPAPMMMTKEWGIDVEEGFKEGFEEGSELDSDIVEGLLVTLRKKEGGWEGRRGMKVKHSLGENLASWR